MTDTEIGDRHGVCGRHGNSSVHSTMQPSGLAVTETVGNVNGAVKMKYYGDGESFTETVADTDGGD